MCLSATHVLPLGGGAFLHFCTVALFQFIVHFTQLFLVQVIDQAKAHKLKRSTDQIQNRHQVAHVQRHFGQLIAFVGTHIAQHGHEDQRNGRAQALGQLAEEGPW